MALKEAKARIKINKLLEEAGWRFEDNEDGPANILLENNTKISSQQLNDYGEDFEKINNGYIDFLLLDTKGFPFVVLEAKSEDKHPLFGKEQARKYATAQKCRFVILSNGNSHFLWDIEQGNPRAISVFPPQNTLENIRQHITQPDSIIKEIIDSDYIVLSQKPNYKQDASWIDPNARKQYIGSNKLSFLRPYQLKAMQSIQGSVKEGKDRFLFEMATGTGKTLVSAAVIRLFLRTRNAKRVLFLVDRLELEDQAHKAFNNYLKNDYRTVIYKENRDDWRKTEIVVSTIQTFLSKNRYKRLFKPDDFDLVISDEAHRSISGNSRAVFEYFIGYKLGLTATPKDYLKNINPNEISSNDPREMERRLLLDTYLTFGCENGIPTYRYSLLDGVKDGYLINPIIIDVRTDITTELLSKQGYAVKVINEEDGSETEEIFNHKDFEKKFFSEKTNRIICQTLLEHALRDPISGEIGKTIAFCVGQKHAAKITQMLNEIADEMFPGKYQSDFAVQVTSSITDSQQFTLNFTNNRLSGTGNFEPLYKTSKTRICVTYGMMTTGYDCPDILNLALLRPIFSPTDFIQIKGRGTRKHDFSTNLIDPALQKKIGSKEKENYKLFDFFANCEYFENEFKYDEILKLPRENHTYTEGIEVTVVSKECEIFKPDYVHDLTETFVGPNGMKIDQMYFNRFQEKVRSDPIIQDYKAKGSWKEMLKYIEENIFNKPEEYFTLENLRKVFNIDRKITTQEMIEKVFDMIPYFKSKDELLDEEFDKFDSRYLPKEEYFDYAKAVFKAYILDVEFRKIIEEKQFALLNLRPGGESFKKLSPDLRKLIPEYIKENRLEYLC